MSDLESLDDLPNCLVQPSQRKVLVGDTGDASYADGPHTLPKLVIGYQGLASLRYVLSSADGKHRCFDLLQRNHCPQMRESQFGLAEKHADLEYVLSDRAFGSIHSETEDVNSLILARVPIAFKIHQKCL